jgi:hypothetical protein
MLKQQIQSDATEALKSRDQLKSGTLRMLLAAIVSREKEKRYKISKQKPEMPEQELIKESELTAQEIIEVILSEIKKRKDAIALYEKGRRQELAEKEKKEIEILKKYLPEQLSEEELQKIVKEAIEKTGASSMKDMGKIMAEVMPKIKGKADGSSISKVVKELLTKSDLVSDTCLTPDHKNGKTNTTIF